MQYGDRVAVAIVSFFSELTILEALESVLAQSYPRIELVLADDHSTDQTVNLIETWVKENGGRFECVKTIFQPKNKGISANCNDALRLVESEWVAVIAADDILMEHFLEDNVRAVVERRLDSILFSQFRPFRRNGGKKIMLEKDWEEIRYIKRLVQREPGDQYRMLIRREILFSPSLFVNMETFREIGGFDEQIRNVEDWPLKINIAKSGRPIHFLDQETMYYYVGDSVSHSRREILKRDHVKQVEQIKKIYCYPNISRWHLLYYYEEIVIRIKNFVLICLLRNQRNPITETVNLAFNLLLPKKWMKVLFWVFRLRG